MPSTLSISHVGIDVSKERLDVYCLEQDRYFQIENNEKGFKQLIKELPAGAKVLLEATGKLERAVAIALDKKNISVCIVNPVQTYHYAKSKGILAKTDKIDSRVLASFLKETKELRFGIPSKEQFQCADYQKRRDQLKKTITQEKNRIKRMSDDWLKKQMQKNIDRTEEDLKALEEHLKALIDENPQTKQIFNLLKTIPSVGDKTAMTIVSSLPELGSINKKAISKLVGIAPMAKDSGRSKGKRSIAGGRQDVRDALYMAALVASRSHKTIQPYYVKLLGKGKPKKVALVACMNKLLRCMHSVVSNQKPFEYI